MRWTYAEGRRTGKEAFSWSVLEVSESECPVSAITQKSFDLVQIVNMLQSANKSTGAALPAGEMPGHLLDAIRVVQSESQACEVAMEEANQ